MSDYMFQLDNHLNSEQSRFMAALQAACDAVNVNVFLAGGAMRDMLGGFPVRDLDFVVEGNAQKLAQALEKKHAVGIVSEDDLRKSADLRFPSGVTASIS